MGQDLTSPKQPAGAMAYMSQLDGLRGIAIVGPLLTHFLPADHALRTSVPWGDIGVDLFFVLSGFLITAILLRCRDLTETGKQGLGFTLGRFYIRRFLRIFPLFYALLAIAAVLNLDEVRNTFYWHFLYLSNIVMTIHDRGFGHATHFWSLAVEEQFYLVWPLFILLAPKHRLIQLTALMVVLAIMFRLGASVLPLPWLARRILPIACVDALGLGSLLALYRADASHTRALTRLTSLGLRVGAPLTVLLTIVAPLHVAGSAAHILLGRFAHGLFSVWLIHRAAIGFNGVPGLILGRGPLPYLGKITYGIYVIHHFVPEVMKKFMPGYDAFSNWPLTAKFAVWTGVSVAISAVSWHLFESPINNLKAKYPYKNRKNEPGGTVQAAPP